MKLFVAFLGVMALAGCQSIQMPGGDKKAQANLEARSGSQVAGTVSFTERGDKVQVVAKVSGLKPSSEHGFHIHEKGDCSAPDGTSAGGHFNPDGNPHNHPTQAKRHAGDLPELVANAKGEAEATFQVDTIEVNNGKHGILGRAVIVHANPDDYKTQPTGNAGGRIACGIIRGG